ncbi:Lsr2 family protein [Streptomyces sp. RKAG293]|uniref:histone-like nucleoid-structuring protein Lsr2 n=1 Tax=Streptomyces sp. RKAG293 TaxID=2893403 RepID=UPI0020348D11|nr:Lsr2 family protein [Streptomyces sp. RKAG293]MCM2417658.1 Lsr2 family protein [Streptomyces sp. RKAG293]
MARRVITVDDLDQKSESAENIVWGLDGEWYEIDLSEANAARLRGLLEPYLAASRPTKAPRARASNGDDSQAIRDWAATQRIPMNDKGPIPADIRRQYEAAKAAVPAAAAPAAPAPASGSAIPR